MGPGLSWWRRDWGRLDRLLERTPWHYAVVGAILVLCLFLFGFCDRSEPPSPPTLPEIRTVPLKTFERIVRDYEEDHKGLTDRLRGWESREPEVVVVTDTIQAPPEACIPQIVVKDGELSYPIYEKTPAGYAASSRQQISITNCDDGLSVIGAEVRCNRALLGHLFLTGGVYAQSVGFDLFRDPNFDHSIGGLQGGVMWEPSYRSAWQAAITYSTDGRLRMGITRKVQLF